jgi:ADP-ribosylation factor-like protein 3
MTSFCQKVFRNFVNGLCFLLTPGRRYEPAVSSTIVFWRSNIRFLGLDNAGKTTILKALSSESPANIAPTRGFNVKQLKRGNVEFDIWDIGGQKALRAYWSGYYDKVRGLVWVIDSADARRMEETGCELAALLQEEKLAGVPVLVLANKQDLATASAPDDVCFVSNTRLPSNSGSTR